MLDDYFAILNGKRPARHSFSSHIPAGAASLDEIGESDLWRLHEEAMVAFYEAWNSCIIPPRDPKPSLLDLKAAIARHMIEDCRLCERSCGVNREDGELGYCGVPATPRIASNFLHFGEEPEIVPSHTIFFSGCTFRCAYCQNWDIAMDARCGSSADPAALVASIREGIVQGSRNANFVGGDPTPALHTVLDTLAVLDPYAPNLPAIWNSNMYASAETMRLLAGVIDVYLADFRYGNDDCALKYSSVENYFGLVSRNLVTAHEQGEIMLRLLLLPGHLSCCAAPIMEWVASHMPDVYFNLMFQYHPDYRASLYPEIDRRPSAEEKAEALALARRLRLRLG